MFSTIVVKDILRLIAKLFLFVSGWKVEGLLPKERKFIMIAAPHTSNWDLPYMLAICFVLDVKPYWMGKAQIFSFPFKGLMKWMAGIPIDRSKTNNVVDATVDIMKGANDLIITVPPEGTRSKVNYWKTGFYHIAHQSGVPIVFGYLDYKRRAGGIGGVFHPTGDIDADMVDIKRFYNNISGKFTSKQGE